jgi:hypothetical protein
MECDWSTFRQLYHKVKNLRYALHFSFCATERPTDLQPQKICERVQIPRPQLLLRIFCSVSAKPPSSLSYWPSPCTLHQGPAICGPWAAVWPSTFLCGPPHDWGICQCEKGKHFLLLRNNDINICALRKKGKQAQKKNIMTKKCCRCRSIMLKSHYYAKVHCSVVQNMWHLIKQCENYCGIKNWSCIKLTLTLNQNCSKANKQHLYNEVNCVEKYSYYPS